MYYKGFFFVFSVFDTPENRAETRRLKSVTGVNKRQQPLTARRKSEARGEGFTISPATND
jgi:hypothetical protein